MKCKVLVEKFSANGELDRIKAHLAANGAQQDCLLYPKQSSSTASIQTTLTKDLLAPMVSILLLTLLCSYIDHPH
jgi:hypothetical protein